MDSYSFDVSEISKLKQLVREKFHRATELERKEAHTLETRLEELVAEQTALIQKNIKGILSDSVLQRELARIEKTELEIRSTLAIQTSYRGSPEDAVAFTSEYLEQPSVTWKKSGITTQTKLQWFQFPSGIVLNGQIFGTPEISCVFAAKELILSPLSSRVDRTGFEPATPSLQMRCSTN